jgi:hypothetical protein
MDQIPVLPTLPRHPAIYSGRLFLETLVIIVAHSRYWVHELFNAFERPTSEVQTLRGLVTGNGCNASRRNWDR